MRTIILIFVLVLFACNSKNENREKSSIQKKADRLNENIKNLEDNQDEKITLYSIVTGVDKNTLITVISDYETKKSYSSGHGDIEKIIDTISFTRLIAKHTVAKIVFGYKYEMITKDDIVESLEQDYIDEQEPLENR